MSRKLGRAADQKAFKTFRTLMKVRSKYNEFDARRKANVETFMKMPIEELAKVPSRDLPAGVPKLRERYLDAVSKHPVAEKNVSKGATKTILAASQDPDAGRLPGRGETALDSLQLAGDVAGVLDQTGVADGINAAVSLGRAATDKERRGEHLTNAAISAVGMIPIVGDLPKLLKAKRAKQTLGDASRLTGGGKRAGAGAEGAGSAAGKKATGGTEAAAGGQSGPTGPIHPKAIDQMTDVELAKVHPLDLPTGVPDLEQRHAKAVASHPSPVEAHHSLAGRPENPADVFSGWFKSVFSDRPRPTGQRAAGSEAVAGSQSTDAIGQVVTETAGARLDAKTAADMTDAELAQYPAEAIPQDAPDLVKRHAQATMMAKVMAGDTDAIGKMLEDENPIARAAGLGGGRRGGSAGGDGGRRKRSADDAEARGDGHPSPGSADSAGADSGGSGGGRPPGGPGSLGDDPDDGRSSDEFREDYEGKRKLRDITDELTKKFEDLVLQSGKYLFGLIAAVETIRLTNKGALAVSRDLAEVNGQIAMAEARREIAGIRRDIRAGHGLEDAYDRAADADIRMDDVRERFTTPVKAMGTELTSSLTNIAASMVELADEVTHASKALSALSRITGRFSENVASTSKTVKDFASGLFGGGAASQGFNSATGNGKLPNATSGTRLLDDLADGKLDGKSKAGDFFSKQDKP